MISVRNLTKSYMLGDRRHYVFKDVSFDFPADKNIGILGPNGAGKSTLLRILGGIDYPDSGEVYRNASLSWPLGLRGGFVGHMTGRENCRMICNAYGVPNSQMRKKVKFIKELSKIDNYFEQPVAYYSSGMASRLGFALSMAFDFDYFLIDEITAVGDAHFKKLAKEALEQKRKTSKVIMVSHSMNDLKRFCDVAVLIKDGVVTTYEDFDDAIEAYLPKTGHSEGVDSIFKRNGASSLSSAIDAQKSEHSELHSLIETNLIALKKALALKEELNGNASILLYKSAGILARMQQPLAALELIEKAIEIDPYEITFWVQKTNILRRLKRVDAARKSIKKGLQLDSKHPGLLASSALLFYEIGELADTEAAARLALMGNAELIHMWMLLAKLQIHKGEKLDALHFLNQAEKINPGIPQIRSLKSEILFNEGHYADGFLLGQQHFDSPAPIKSDQDWTELAESLLSTIENLNVLQVPS